MLALALLTSAVYMAIANALGMLFTHGWALWLYGVFAIVAVGAAIGLVIGLLLGGIVTASTTAPAITGSPLVPSRQLRSNPQQSPTGGT